MKLPLFSSSKLPEQASTDSVSAPHPDRQATGTHAHWDQLINEWEASGLSQKIFCKQHGLKLKTFSNQRTRQLKMKQTQQKLLPIKLKQSVQPVGANENSFVLMLASGASLVIPSDYNNSVLKDLLDTLGVC